MLVKNRRGRTEQVRIACKKMLFSVDNNWPFFDDAGANSVSTLELLAPDRTCPKTRGLECRIVRDRPSPIDHKPAPIRQQNTTADPSHRHEQPVECALGHPEQWPETLLRADYVGLGKPTRRRTVRGIECVQVA